MVDEAAPGGAIRLERTWWMRATGGWLLQPVFVVFTAILVVVAAIRHDLVSLAMVGIAAVLAAICAVAASGYAEADEHQIRWRCFVPHALDWGAVDRIRLHSQQFATSGGGRGRRPVVRVYSGRRRRTLNPASWDSPATREFTRRLCAMAERKGIETDTRGWPTLYRH